MGEWRKTRLQPQCLVFEDLTNVAGLAVSSTEYGEGNSSLNHNSSTSYRPTSEQMVGSVEKPRRTQQREPNCVCSLVESSKLSRLFLFYSPFTLDVFLLTTTLFTLCSLLSCLTLLLHPLHNPSLLLCPYKAQLLTFPTQLPLYSVQVFFSFAVLIYIYPAFLACPWPGFLKIPLSLKKLSLNPKHCDVLL